MVKTIVKAGFAGACLFMLAAFVPAAHASSVEFSCGAPSSNACTGTVTGTTSTGFSTTGIGLLSNFDGTDMFTATFTTNSSGTGSISISDGDGESLSGSIAATAADTSFGGDETLTFDVNWTSLSAGVQAALGSTSGVGQSTVEFSVSDGTVGNASLHLNSGGTGPGGPGTTPEPSTLLLLGTGLLGLGMVFRRRISAIC